MTPSGSTIINDLYQSAIEAISTLDLDSLDAAFVEWTLSGNKKTIEAKLPDPITGLDYKQIAQLGFLCYLNADLRREHLSRLEEGLMRMTGRSAKVSGALAEFTMDAIALVGLSLGASISSTETLLAVRTWLDTFVPSVGQGLPPWKRILMFTALQIVKSSKALTIPIEDSPLELKIGLSQIGIMTFIEDTDLANIVKDLYTSAIKIGNPEKNLLGFKLRVIDYVIDSAPAISLNYPTHQQLVAILERVTSSFRRWTWENRAKTKNSALQKWDIQNEYHVQNFLYFMLSPIFPDLEDEFYLEQLAQKNPRADLGIPSLNVIIEVKFWRPGKSISNLIDEIAADNSLYFSASSEYTIKYKHLIVFVWDEARRNQEHHKFKQGINSLSNVLDTILISRPGNM